RSPRPGTAPCPAASAGRPRLCGRPWRPGPMLREERPPRKQRGGGLPASPFRPPPRIGRAGHRSRPVTAAWESRIDWSWRSFPRCGCESLLDRNPNRPLLIMIHPREEGAEIRVDIVAGDLGSESLLEMRLGPRAVAVRQPG